MHWKVQRITKKKSFEVFNFFISAFNRAQFYRDGGLFTSFKKSQTL